MKRLKTGVTLNGRPKKYCRLFTVIEKLQSLVETIPITQIYY